MSECVLYDLVNLGPHDRMASFAHKSQHLYLVDSSQNHVSVLTPHKHTYSA